MNKSTQKLTPMMRQYLEIKEQHQDAILFFRLGDFYEMFFEDAVKASEILEIALTSRNKNEESSVPLCGIPYHSAAGYIRKLIESGQKVAICEQVEDPAQAKGIVKREVIRVISPGLMVDEETLRSGEANYLALLAAEGEGYHLIFFDLSTGEVLVGFYENQEFALQELLKHRAKEVICSREESGAPLLKKLHEILPHLLVTFVETGSPPDWEAAGIFSQSFLDSRQALESKVARTHLDTLLGYVYQTQKSVLKHLHPVQVLRRRHFLGLDERTFRNLELTRNLRGEGRSGTLFSVLNQTATPMGSRRLMKWIQYPLLDLSEIQARQAVVGELHQKAELSLTIQEGLRQVKDVERMLGKLALGSANARDLHAMGRSLRNAQELLGEIFPQVETQHLKVRLKAYPHLEALFEKILKTLKDELPATLKEGGLIAPGVHSELDELRQVSRDGKGTIAAMEEKERKRTKIPSLKIRYNKVFGYYIEVTHTHRKNVPEDYIRKQTLTNAERYITPDLKEYESKVLGADERIKNLEYQLFCDLRDECAGQMEPLRQAADILASLDVFVSLARVARDYNYVRPELVEERALSLKDCRHPVLERQCREERFIPNDLEMDSAHRLFLITGPNMAGKSTIMRQAALIVLMAQMGSFVPATQARIGLADQLFTRIGASDDLSQGQSTFMVEMLETANILKLATEKSFIVLDEIGRGTSTYDGMSIAWALAEHIGEKLKCRAMFATHYHELVELGGKVDGVVNYQVAVKEWNNQILFLRKLVPGGASRSYGIEVARLAGLPKELVARAKQVLKQLENVEGSALEALDSEAPPNPQMALFNAGSHPALEEIRQVSLEQMTPIEALNLLYKIKGMTEE